METGLEAADVSLDQPTLGSKCESFTTRDAAGRFADPNPLLMTSQTREMVLWKSRSPLH
jgi:hypothetical protein